MTLDICSATPRAGVYVFTYREYRRRDPPLLIYCTLRAIADDADRLRGERCCMIAPMQMPAYITAFFLTLSVSKYVIYRST